MIHSGLIAFPLEIDKQWSVIIVEYPGGLKIDVFKDGDQGGYDKLSNLDKSAVWDGQVTVEDFGGDETKLLDATCDAFFPSPPGVVTRQEKGFREFVGLYGRIEKFSKFTDELRKKNKTAGFGSELEFSEKDWPEVKRQMTGDGPFTPQKISKLANDVYRTFRMLEGRYNAEPPMPISNRPDVVECGGVGIVGFVYDYRPATPLFYAQVNRVVEAYLNGANFLRKYREVECDDWGWDSCEDTKIKIDRVEYLKKIEKGDKSDDITSKKSCQ